MGPPINKTLYLQNDGNFYEVTVEGCDTTIRYGKLGRLGRKCPTKKHPTPSKAIQFARRNVNAKIMLGYSEPSSLLKRKSSVLTPNPKLLRRASIRGSSGRKPAWKNPPKKRDSIRKLCRQSTTLIPQEGNSSSSPLLKQVLTKSPSRKLSASSNYDQNKTPVTSPHWRKPHRKQSTIRRLARKMSLNPKTEYNEQTPTTSKNKNSLGSPRSKLSRKSTIIMKS